MAPEPVPRVRIEVWSDIVCPFCWIGKRHLEEALRRAGAEDRVEVVFRAFELDPAHGPSGPLRQMLARKFGSPERADGMIRHVEAMGARTGLRFAFPQAVAANTFDAHRLALHAQALGQGRSMMERLMLAHFQEGADLADLPTLRRLAVDAGLEAAGVDEVLASDRYSDAVRADEAQARAYGAGGVPFFVIDGRYGISGAQPVEAFEDVLRRVLP